MVNGVQIGDDLTDNSYDPTTANEFSEHSPFLYAACSEWSPVVRANLNKAKSARYCEVEDGGRRPLIEEGVSS